MGPQLTSKPSSPAAKEVKSRGSSAGAAADQSGTSDGSAPLISLPRSRPTTPKAGLELKESATEKVAGHDLETGKLDTMASPRPSAHAASSVGQASLSASPANSNATAATFGHGSRTHPNNNAGPRLGQDHQQRRGSAMRTDTALSPTPAHVIEGPGGRILCVADVRGNLSSLNKLAAETDAQAILHTGDFGFYEAESFERISDRTLRHLVQYSTLIPPPLRAKLLSADVPGGRTGAGAGGAPAAPPPPTTSCKEMRTQMLSHPDSPLLTEFPSLLSGKLRLNVPVYTVWGACEDVRILEKIRTREYVIDNLHVLDEASTVAIEVGGVRLRLFGLGGAVVLHKLFDNGEGAATIAGGQGTMWTTILQIGELVDTAQKCYDPTETRLLVTHASPGREGLLMQLALALKADLTISAGLHFRYGVSYNEFSVQSDTEQFRRKLLQSKSAFGEVWDSVRAQVEDVVDDQQRILLNNGLAVTNRAPNAATATGAVHEEPAWKNTWNWNLPDAAFGHLVLDIHDGRVSSEMKSQGFNFAYRRAESNASPVNAHVGAQAGAAAATGIIPTGPAKMRQQQDTANAVSSPAPVPRGPMSAKSPKQHRSPAASQGGAPSDKEELTSRPTSSRGPRHEKASRSGEENILPKGPRAATENGQAAKSRAEGHTAEVSNGTTTSGAGGVPASASNQSIKSGGKAPKNHRSNKKSGSGWSSRSEKSGSESEAKHATRVGADAGKEGVATPAGAQSGGEEKAEGGEGSSAAPRGGGRGRGGSRGGRGGRGGGSGRGGGHSQERRKSNVGGGEQKVSTGGDASAKASAGGSA